MENPISYTSASGMQKRDAVIVLNKYMDRFHWEDDDEVLDFGCGPGDITRHLLAECIPRFGRITGVDISGEMIHYAKMYHQVYDERLDFQQVDLMNIIQPSQVFPQGFDKILSFYCLHWIKDHRKLMEIMHQLTKPDAEILLVFLASNPIFTMYKRLSERTEWAEYMKDVDQFIPNYHNSPTPAQDFTDLCHGVGFDVVECEAVDLSYPYENANHARDAVVAVNPFLKRIPPKFQDRYLMDGFAELQKLKAPTTDGSTAMVARYRLMIAHIRKPSE